MNIVLHLGLYFHNSELHPPRHIIVIKWRRLESHRVPVSWIKLFEVSCWVQIQVVNCIIENNQSVPAEDIAHVLEHLFVHVDIMYFWLLWEVIDYVSAEFGVDIVIVRFE